MNLKSSGDNRQMQRVKFLLPDPVRSPESIVLCPRSEPFAAVCETLLQETSVGTTDITVNLALLILQEKFFACYEHAPAACRKHMQANKVICLFQIYRQTYLKLFELRLKVTPPRLREEPQPPAQITKVYKYDGFAIGETVIEDDEDE